MEQPWDVPLSSPFKKKQTITKHVIQPIQRQGVQLAGNLQLLAPSGTASALTSSPFSSQVALSQSPSTIPRPQDPLTDHLCPRTATWVGGQGQICI